MEKRIALKIHQGALLSSRFSAQNFTNCRGQELPGVADAFLGSRRYTSGRLWKVSGQLYTREDRGFEFDMCRNFWVSGQLFIHDDR